MAPRRADKETAEFKKLFAARLRSLRKEHGLTQSALGDKVGVDGSVIRSYELKLHHPPLLTLQKLASVFGVSVDFLLNGSARPEGEFEDRELLRLFLKADRLHHTSKGALKQVIEAFVAAEELKQAS